MVTIQIRVIKRWQQIDQDVSMYSDCSKECVYIFCACCCYYFLVLFLSQVVYNSRTVLGSWINQYGHSTLSHRWMTLRWSDFINENITTEVLVCVIRILFSSFSRCTVSPSARHKYRYAKIQIVDAVRNQLSFPRSEGDSLIIFKQHSTCIQHLVIPE